MVGRVGEPIDPDAVVAAAREALAADPAPYVERVERLRSGLRPAALATLEAIGRSG